MHRKKRIGVVTYWESLDNYGQQLQCWALQQFLLSIGHSPFLIRVRMFMPYSQGYGLKYIIKRFIRWIKDGVCNIIINIGGLHLAFISNRLVNIFGKDWVYRRFNVFQKKCIKSTRIFNNSADLLKFPPLADVYIAGSDQIWNADLTDEIWKITFLQFGDKNIKRVAYAPSMSMNNLDSDQERVFSQYLQSFSSLSAREQKTVERCINLGYNCELVLDPTLLISRNYYDQIVRSKYTKPYIFMYTINYENANEIPKISELESLISSKLCDVIVTTGGGYIKNEEIIKGDVKYDYATIPEWIGNIKDAELVVTPSFHGIVFSILFHRNFIFTPLSGHFSVGNERVFDLLERLEIKGHVWGEENLMSHISWKHVDDIIESMRNKSSLYLQNSINSIK